ncbi:MAG TPA: TonB family protein [Candidatus Baltobacteraceae bacterium]|nr:TonB family protein [Candidatus Baltobacteraceae bacterium]
MNRIHDRIESLAGAIALGEATDAERLEYREHLSSCSSCLQSLGGEHELERTASVVADARESETWQPDLGNVVAARMRRRAQKWQYGFGIAGLCVAVSLGVHAVFATGVTPLEMRSDTQTFFDVGTTRIVLEQRGGTAKAPAAQTASTPQRQLVVMHNVVSMQRAPVAAAARHEASATIAEPRQIASVTVHPQAPAVVKPQTSGAAAKPLVQNAPAWRTVATTTLTSQVETAPQTLTHNAESISFGPLRHDRDTSVVGGDTAINPQPPMIAYDEGASGTSAFEVLVDEHGSPTKCVITKSSGYLVLDNAVCKAAMAAKYLPKVQDGRAVAGVYRDAFTFRMQDNPSIEGIPHDVPGAKPHNG